MTTTTVTTNAHGDLRCTDVENLLTEITTEAATKGQRVADLEAKYLTAVRDGDQARRDAARAQSLIFDIRSKLDELRDEKGALAAQVQIIMTEMDALEEVALPEGTFTHGVLSGADILVTYRQVTRIRRGPMPQAMTTRLEGARADIGQAMNAAGMVAVEDVIRKETRRVRRANQRATARRQTA